jgi:hypothetical protein
VTASAGPLTLSGATGASLTAAGGILTLTGNTGALLTATNGTTDVTGATGASLTATNGTASVTASAGVITLTSGAAILPGLALAGIGLPATAAGTTGAFSATHRLDISVGGVLYYIPLSSSTW